MDIQETIKNLRQWSKEYAEGNPSVSDQVWDEAVEKLREEAPDCEFFKKAVSEPTPSSTRKEKLPQPMLSLDKVKQVEKLEEWLGDVIGEGWKDTWLVIHLNLMVSQLFTWGRNGGAGETVTWGKSWMSSVLT